MLAGLAVQEAVQRLAVETEPAAVGLKWPNDVILIDRSDAKIAGILAESTITGDEASVVLGIGINIKFSTSLPDEIAHKAVCLADLGLVDDSQQHVLTAVLASLERWLSLAEASGPSAILAEYEKRCTTVGKNITFTGADGETVTGRASGLDPAGGLLVQTASGTRTVFSSDIYHIGLTT